MGRYLDRLHEEFDDITRGVTDILERAADEGREVTPDETAQIERSDTRRDELTQQIEHYTGVEERTGRIATMRNRIPTQPTQQRTGPDREPEYDILRDFPSAAHWAIAVHRSMTMRDAEATAAIERATAHQMTTDNPGLIPRPILGPVLNLLDGSRPVISSITRRPLPTGKFDRPTISQHVDVQKQAVEKDLTASQKMVIGNIPVTASTWAGHLNISRQDIKWTSPGILQIVFDDFAAVYADRTDADVCTAFAASVTQTTAGGDTFAQIMTNLYAAAAGLLTAGKSLPDTLWCPPDVWGQLGGMTNAQGGAAFPSLTLTGTSGNPLGLKLVVDPHLAAGVAIMGASRFAEFYEDVDGLLQVQEPDVLGQLVGYAGYGAFVNVNPNAFTKLTGIGTIALAEGGESQSSGGGGGSSTPVGTTRRR
jgi:HK97 family phage major capsid protein